MGCERVDGPSAGVRDGVRAGRLRGREKRGPEGPNVDILLNGAATISAVTVLIPDSLDRAVAQLADHPEAHVIAGGTDVMVEVNFGHRRPEAVLSLGRVPELKGWRRVDDRLVLGAGVTYTELLDPAVAELAPALAQAARTVGSPQIRNAGTVGGNLGTGSPAGDTLPVLIALDAVLTLVSLTGTRDVALAEFCVGPKRTTLRPGELISSVTIPVAAGPQEYLKVGPRNAMVISVAGLAAVADSGSRTVAVGLGSVGPVPLRAPEAEAFASERVDWRDGRLSDPADAEEFGRLTAAAARPIDDHRSTADYRRHCVGVLARRALTRMFAA
jgi:CO/xanthine dehydrogenase FAD-binding subunit